MGRVAIFDLDGVVFDTLKDMHGFLRRLCMTNGKPFPYAAPANVRHLLDSDYPTVYRSLGFDWEREQAMITAAYQSYFGSVESSIVTGITAVLDGLRADGFLLGVATGRHEREALADIERHALQFDAIVTHPKDRGLCKPHPHSLLEVLRMTQCEPHDALYIGDTPSDIIAARRVVEYKDTPMRALGVAWGWSTVERLRKEGAPVAMSPSEIPHYLASA